MPTLDDARRLLEQHFGYPDFRPSQRDVVAAVLARQDVLAVLPTGAGKSACFQVPALALGGLTLVVSPLISLMTDQVAACLRRGIPAAALTSATSPAERRAIEAMIEEQSLRLLYVSPERLETLADRLRRRVTLLAVDEAHCISEWGPDFRPAFRQLGALRSALGRPPAVALTGSATPAVRSDIIAVLGLGTGRRLARVVASFDRPNLYFAAQRIAGERERMRCLLAALDASEPLAIVYTPTRSITEALTRALRFAGFDTVPYHAGLEQSFRKQALERFDGSSLHIVIATFTFGMGIDPPNVRVVVHSQMPPTLEAYYQEAGRAGRDGNDARCVLLYREGDAELLRRELETTFPPARLIERLWRDEAALAAAPAGLKATAQRLRKELAGTGAAGWAAVAQRRKAAEARIESVERYATTSGCRRGVMLGYFGEQGPKRCGACDRCA